MPHESLGYYLDRIICADALTFTKELPDRCIDLILTDPPYGDNLRYGKENLTIRGDEHPLLALSVMAQSYRLLKMNRTAYMFCSLRNFGFIRSFFDSYTPYKFKELIIWDKLVQGFGRDFRRQYECILALEKGKPMYRYPGMANLLRFLRVRAARHPHEKPVALLKTLIGQSSDAEDVVFDPFLGAGSTAVAAQESGRHFIGVEIESRYCRIAQERLQEAAAGSPVARLIQSKRIHHRIKISLSANAASRS